MIHATARACTLVVLFAAGMALCVGLFLAETIDWLKGTRAPTR